MVFPFKIKNPPKRVGLGNKGCYYYLSFPVGAHDLERLDAIQGRAGRFGNKLDLCRAPRHRLGVVRQPGINVGVDDAVGIVL